MSFPLPPADHIAREHYDLATLAEQLDPANVARLPDFRAAVANARRSIDASNGAISGMTVVCLRGDDERWLVHVGPRGGWRKLWNFGTGRH
jgi:hypothetical protein